MANWLPRDLRDDFEADNYEAQAAQIISGATERIKQAQQAASDTVSGAVQGATDAAQTATSGLGDLVGGLVASWQDDNAQQPRQPAAPTLAGSWEDPTAPRPVRPASGTPAAMPTAPRRVLPSTGEELADPVITTGPLDRSSRQAFMGSLLPSAIAAVRSRGLPDSLAAAVIAIPINEQGHEREAPGNNLFGIKGRNPRTGASQVSRTWEEVNGQRVETQAEFRAYGSPQESVADFIDFLETNPRYARALEIGRQTGDPEAFIRAVHAAGYATDSQWADKIVSIARSAPFVEAAAPGLQGQRRATLGQAEEYPLAEAQGRNGFNVVDINDVASRYGGGRYVFGGGRDGKGQGLPGVRDSDCSAFVSAVWSEKGIPLVAHTDGAYNQLRGIGAPEIGLNDARPGDIVFYMGAGTGGAITHHMGIYAGNGMVLDQSVSGGEGVRVRSVGHAGEFVIMRDPRMVPETPQTAREPRPIKTTGFAEQTGGVSPQVMRQMGVDVPGGQGDDEDMQRAPLSVGERLAQSWSEEPLPEDAAEGGLRVQAKYDAVPDLSQQPDDPDRGPREALPGSVGSQPLPQTGQNYPMRFEQPDTNGQLFGPEEPEDTIEAQAGRWVRDTALPAVQSAAGAMFDPDRPARIVQEAASRLGMRWEPRRRPALEGPESAIDPELPYLEALDNARRRGFTSAGAGLVDAAAETSRMLGMPRAADAFEEWADDLLRNQDRRTLRRRTRDALDGPFGVVEAVVESAPSLLPTVLGAILAAGGVATGNPMLAAAGTGVARAGLAMGGASAFGSQARELRPEVAKGRMSQATANAVAIGAGLVEVATEKLFPGADQKLVKGMGQLAARRMLADLRNKGLVGAGKTIAREAGQEAAEEAVAESYGVAVDSVFKEKKPSLMEAARRIGAAAATGAASGAVVTGAMQGVEAAADRAARRRVGEDVDRAMRATQPAGGWIRGGPDTPEGDGAPPRVEDILADGKNEVNLTNEEAAQVAASLRERFPGRDVVVEPLGRSKTRSMVRVQDSFGAMRLVDSAKALALVPRAEPSETGQQPATTERVKRPSPADLVRRKPVVIRGATADGRRFWSNGEILEFGDAPKGIDRAKSVQQINREAGDLDPALKQFERHQREPVSIVRAPVEMGTGKDAFLVYPVRQEGRRTIAVNATYADYFLAKYPGATFDAPITRSAELGAPNGPVRVMSGGQTIGYIMPVTTRTDESVAKLDAAIAGTAAPTMQDKPADMEGKTAEDERRWPDIGDDELRRSLTRTEKDSKNPYLGKTTQARLREQAGEIRAELERRTPKPADMEGKTAKPASAADWKADPTKMSDDELRSHIDALSSQGGRSNAYGSRARREMGDALAKANKELARREGRPNAQEQAEAMRAAEGRAPATAPASAPKDDAPAGDARASEFDGKPADMEGKGAPTVHEYSSTQLNLPKRLGERVRAFGQRAIDDGDLAEDGREDAPHVTVKYGLTTENADEIRAIVERHGPITIELGKTSIFENDGFDVVKVDVESPELRALNAELAKLPNGDKHPEYKPHLTLAYVKPGQGKRYVGMRGVEGELATIHDLTFSSKTGEQVSIPLKGKESAPAAPSGGTLEAEDGERDGRAGADGSPGRAGATREPAEPRAATGAQRQAPRVRDDEGAVGPQPGEDAGGAERPRSSGSRERSVQGTRPELTDAPARKPTETGQSPAPSPLSAGQDAVFDPKDDALREKSAPRRFDRNLEALELLAKLEAEQRPATAAEQKILSRYSGFGDTGFNEAFPADGEPKEGIWATRRNRLKAALNALYPDDPKAGERAFKSVERSRTNAMYTTPEVIAAMWRGLERMGVGNLRRPRVLEPSSGSGRFVGLMPSDVAAKAQKALVELDDATGRLARKLFPASFVQVTGFQDAVLPDNGFDVAISNVPFSEVGVLDRDWPRSMAHLQKPLHNYFFAKALDKVRPGGVIAFVTSRYTMDGTDATAVAFREHMAEHADLVAAVRLPSGAFPDTKVTTDIIFLQKRDPKDGPGDTTWVGTTEQSVETEYDFKTWTGSVEKRTTTTKFNLNNYYVENPSNVLGEHAAPKSGGLYGGFEYTVSMSDPKWLARLNRIMGRLPQDALRESVAPAPALSDMQQTAYAARQRPGGYYIGEDGKLMIARLDGRRVTPEPANLPATAEKRVRGMLGIRDRTQRLLELQSQGAKDADIGAAQHDLAAAYDPFVKTYGPLNARENAALMRTDPDAGLLRSLEQWSERIAKEFPSRPSKADIDGLKAPIFTKRVTAMGTRPERADSPSDAMMIALNETGTLDWDRMASLTGRTPEQLQEALLGEGLVYENPEGGYETADAYLSGPVRVKLRKAEAAARADERFQRNVDALKSVVPEDLEPGEIVVGLGAPWVPVTYLNAFARDVLGLYSLKPGERAIFEYLPERGGYVQAIADNDISSTSAKDEEWATPYFSTLELLEKALAGKTPVAYDKVDNRRVQNEPQTQLAKDKIDKIRERFSAWVWEDPQRAADLAEIYNDTLNGTVAREYDGSHLTFPGANPEIKLRPHQKNAVWRIIQDGTVLLAHEVGFGKTFEMIAAGMELRRLGLSKRNLYVVKNGTLEQFVKDFRKLYPQAKLLVEDETLTRAKRGEFMARIATGDWDGVVIQQSKFTLLPVKEETHIAYAEARIKELRAAILARRQAGDTRDVVQKQLQKAIDNEEIKVAKLRKALEGRQDNAIYFEDLGIDTLFVDEADLYRRLPFVTKKERIKGIPTSTSQRAPDMEMKARIVSRRNGGRGVVFATGTPISNSIAEVWVMMKYLMPEKLEAMGFGHFDAWADTFGELEFDFVPNPAGVYQPVTAFASFRNLPEMARLWQSVADVMMASDAPEMVKRQPKLVGGERTGDRIIVKSPRTQALVDAMQSFQERLNAIKANRKAFQPPQKGDDTELAVYTAARMAAVDVRMVNPRAPEDPNGKLAKATENIYQIWRDEARDKGTQLVFLDIGTPKPPRPVKEEEEGSPDEDDPTKRDTLTDEERRLAQAVYTRLKDRLVAKGIPAREIALATEPKNKAEFETLMEKVRTGEIRVMIGSTEKMGAGVNVQDRLAALHHVNAPWNPRDIEQREGRIIRQGNRVYGPVVDENDNVKDEGRGVRIYQYVAVGSFDERSWQTLLRKARGIKQLMRRHVTERQIEDMGSLVESFETAKAASSGRPEAVRLVKVMNELDKVGAIRQAWQSGQRTARLEMQRLPGIIAGDEQYLAAVQADAKTLAENPEPRAVIDGKTVEGSTAINGAALAAITKAEQQGEDAEIGTYRGLKIRVGFSEMTFAHVRRPIPAVKLALRGREGYVPSVFPVSALGEAGAVDAAARLRNLAGMVAERNKAAEKYLEDHRAKLKVYEDRLNKPFEYEQRYQSLLRERTQLEEILAKPAEGGATVEDAEGEQVDAGIAEPAWNEPNNVPDVGDYTEGQMRPITRDELVALAFGEVEPRAPVAQPEAAAPAPEPETPAIEAPVAEEEQADAEPDAEPAAVAEAAGEGVPEMSPAAGEETPAEPAPAEAAPEPAPVAPTTQTEQIVSAIDALKAAILGEPTPAPTEAAQTTQEAQPAPTTPRPVREGQRAPSGGTRTATPQADNTAAEPSAPSAPSAAPPPPPPPNEPPTAQAAPEPEQEPEQPSEDVRRDQTEIRLPVLAAMFEEVTPEAIGSFLPEDAPEGMALAIFERLVDDGKVSEDGQVIEGEVIPPGQQQTPPPNDQQPAGPQIIDGTVVNARSRRSGQQRGQKRPRRGAAANQQQPPAGGTPPPPPQPPTPPPPTTGDNPNAEHPDESGDAANAALGKQFRVSMRRDSKRLSPGMIEAIRRAYVRAMTDDRIDLNMLVEEIEREHGKLPAEFRVDLLARMSPGMAAKVKIDEGLKPHLRGLSESDLAWLDVFLTHMDNLDVAKAMGIRAEQETLANAEPFRGKSWRKLQEERRRLAAFEPGGIAENPQKAAQAAKRVKELERQVKRDEVRHQQKVMARAAKRRNTVESERLFSEGLTVADSRRALGALARELGPQRLAKIQKAAVGVWEFNRSLLKAKVDNDVISQELYDELVRLYPHYVPTRIVDFIKDPERDGGPAVGKSLSLNDQGLRRNTLEGTSRRRENPLASTYRNAIETERIIKQNQVALAMKLLIESDSDGLGQEFREAPEGHKLRDGEGYVAGFDKGKRFRYVTGEPMARALKVVSVSPVHPMLRAFMNFWKELITRFPLFWAYQSVQDAATYEMREQSRATGNPLSLGAALADLVVGYAISFRGILSGEYKGSAAEYLKSGGGMAGIAMRDVDSAKERVYDLRRRNVLEIRGPRDIARLIRNGVLFDWSQAISERIELAPRVASYRRAKRAGRSEAEATVAGRDVTLDFLRGGYLARYLNGLLGFFNVGAQASASIPRMWKENPRGFIIMASMWLAAGALIEAAMGGDDDEWEDLPKNLKDRGFLFPSGGTSTTEEGERRPRFFMLPVRELAPLLIPAREVVRRYQGKEGRDLLDLTLATLMAASPIQASGPADFFGSAYPEILATPAQLAMDFDFFRGGPIKTKRNDEQASNLSKWVAGALQFVGDRNESLRGLGTVTPAQVEFAARGYGGHFARTVGAASDIWRDRGQQDRGPMDTPLVGGLLGRFVTDAGGERLRVAQQERNLIALDVRRQLREAQVNVTIGTVRPTIEGVPLRRSEQARYQELANRYTDRELRALLRDGEFKSARGAERAKLVQQAIARGRDAARQQVIDRLPPGEAERRKETAARKAS